MMRLNLMLPLAVSSFFVLISNSSVLYLFTELMLLAFVLNRLFMNRGFSMGRLLWAAILPFAFIINFLGSGAQLSFDYLIRIVNFSLVILVARQSDAFTLIRYVRYLLYVNFFITLMVFVGILPSFFASAIYKNILLFGLPINSGVVFEANYSGIVMGLLVFLSERKVRHYVVAIGSMMLFTFRTGFIAPIIDIVARYNSRILLHGILFSWVVLLVVLYNYMPFALEQRWFIWTSFFDFYEPAKMYSKEAVESFMAFGMQDSPWGESGLNLHSGIFESLLYKGLYYTALSGILIMFGLLSLPKSHLGLLIYFMVISTVFSVSLGGLNLTSMVFSFIVAACLDTDTGKKPIRSSISHHLSAQPTPDKQSYV